MTENETKVSIPRRVERSFLLWKGTAFDWDDLIVSIPRRVKRSFLRIYNEKASYFLNHVSIPRRVGGVFPQCLQGRRRKARNSIVSIPRRVERSFLLSIAGICLIFWLLCINTPKGRALVSTAKRRPGL